MIFTVTCVQKEVKKPDCDIAALLTTASTFATELMDYYGTDTLKSGGYTILVNKIPDEHSSTISLTMKQDGTVTMVVTQGPVSYDFTGTFQACRNRYCRLTINQQTLEMQILNGAEIRILSQFAIPKRIEGMHYYGGNIFNRGDVYTNETPIPEYKVCL